MSDSTDLSLPDLLIDSPSTLRFGIRMALGAKERTILATAVSHGVRLAIAGLSIGMVTALTPMRLLPSFSHLLYGVGGGDPPTFIAVSAMLTFVAILASYVPARRAARRAARVDPAVALRNE